MPLYANAGREEGTEKVGCVPCASHLTVGVTVTVASVVNSAVREEPIVLPAEDWKFSLIAMKLVTLSATFAKGIIRIEGRLQLVFCIF